MKKVRQLQLLAHTWELGCTRSTIEEGNNESSLARIAPPPRQLNQPQWHLPFPLSKFFFPLCGRSSGMKVGWKGGGFFISFCSIFEAF
jgi:hypothetical protein